MIGLPVAMHNISRHFLCDDTQLLFQNGNSLVNIQSYDRRSMRGSVTIVALDRDYSCDGVSRKPQLSCQIAYDAAGQTFREGKTPIESSEFNERLGKRSTYKSIDSSRCMN